MSSEILRRKTRKLTGPSGKMVEGFWPKPNGKVLPKCIRRLGPWKKIISSELKSRSVITCILHVFKNENRKKKAIKGKNGNNHSLNYKLTVLSTSPTLILTETLIKCWLFNFGCKGKYWDGVLAWQSAKTC